MPRRRTARRLSLQAVLKKKKQSWLLQQLQTKTGEKLQRTAGKPPVKQKRTLQTKKQVLLTQPQTRMTTPRPQLKLEIQNPWVQTQTQIQIPQQRQQSKQVINQVKDRKRMLRRRAAVTRMTAYQKKQMTFPSPLLPLATMLPLHSWCRDTAQASCALLFSASESVMPSPWPLTIGESYRQVSAPPCNAECF